MALNMLTTSFGTVDVGHKFNWGSIDSTFQKVDETSAIRVANAPRYVGRTYAFADKCQVKYRPVMHITTDGVNRLCGAVSIWAAHIHYAGDGSSFDDGDWCKECMKIMHDQQGEQAA